MDHRHYHYMRNKFYLNQINPPPKSHRIFGSVFLYDLLMCHLVFALLDKWQAKRKERLYNQPRVIEKHVVTYEELAKSINSGTNIDRAIMKFLNNFMKYKPNFLTALFYYPIKLWIQYIFGVCLLIRPLFFKKQN